METSSFWLRSSAFVKLFSLGSSVNLSSFNEIQWSFFSLLSFIFHLFIKFEALDTVLFWVPPWPPAWCTVSSPGFSLCFKSLKLHTMASCDVLSPPLVPMQLSSNCRPSTAAPDPASCCCCDEPSRRHGRLPGPLWPSSEQSCGVASHGISHRPSADISLCRSCVDRGSFCSAVELRETKGGSFYFPLLELVLRNGGASCWTL